MHNCALYISFYCHLILLLIIICVFCCFIVLFWKVALSNRKELINEIYYYYYYCYYNSVIISMANITDAKLINTFTHFQLRFHRRLPNLRFNTHYFFRHWPGLDVTNTHTRKRTHTPPPF